MSSIRNLGEKRKYGRQWIDGKGGQLGLYEKQGELGVPHSNIQVELDW